MCNIAIIIGFQAIFIDKRQKKDRDRAEIGWRGPYLLVSLTLSA